MHPFSRAEYKQALTEAIRKQLVMLGPDSVFPLLHSIPGLTLHPDGTVIDFTRDPEQVITAYIQAIRNLSPYVAQHTMQAFLPPWEQTSVPPTASHSVSTNDYDPKASQLG